MELKGSKTEKNLMEAFAGESQARNKYTYYASKAKKKATTSLPTSLNKLPTMKKSMPKSGSSSCTAAKFPQLSRTLKTLLPVKTMNGPICMPAWPKKPEKKVLTKSLSCLNLSAKLKKATKKDIRLCWTLCAKAKSLNARPKSFGNAPTAATV